IEKSGDNPYLTSAPITFLIVAAKGEIPVNILDELNDRRPNRRGNSIRIRVWDREYLTSLVQQFPQIGFKYFSDEGRSRTKYRKTPEELYQETEELAVRLKRLNEDL